MKGSTDAFIAKIQTAAPLPAISPNGVVSGASFQTGIVPNSWVAIYGTNLSTVSDYWTIDNGQFPTQLDGVSVSIGGQPAYVEFVSPGQINVLAPNIAAGPVQVTVTNSMGTSQPVPATAALDGPAFFFGLIPTRLRLTPTTPMPRRTARSEVPPRYQPPRATC